MTVTDPNPLRGTDWDRYLRQEFDKPYWRRLQAFVKEERSRHTVYPPCGKVFTALRLTSCLETKVVIVGQDPYASEGQAHGLCFSVPSGVTPPPALRNILKELHDDWGVTSGHGSLEPWAHRGVLLLNTILTVRAGEPGSHRGKGWETFTDEVIRVVNEKTDLVFMLWGKDAQRKTALIEESRNTVICSPHPSPRAAWRGFLGSRPFSQANGALVAADKQEVDWSLTA
jgi:uracil-DNA glycosylase